MDNATVVFSLSRPFPAAILGLHFGNIGPMDMQLSKSRVFEFDHARIHSEQFAREFIAISENNRSRGIGGGFGMRTRQDNPTENHEKSRSSQKRPEHTSSFEPKRRV
jgi:hypothetical protein